MPDDKSKVDAKDRSQVAGDEDYEVRYFAERNGISVQEARTLIERFGNDRKELERRAAQMRKDAKK
jgi:hypothetical protein